MHASVHRTVRCVGSQGAMCRIAVVWLMGRHSPPVPQHRRRPQRRSRPATWPHRSVIARHVAVSCLTPNFINNTDM